MALFRINMQTMELDSYSVSLATVVRALLLNDWKGKSAALPGHCPGGPVPAAAYAPNPFSSSAIFAQLYSQKGVVH